MIPLPLDELRAPRRARARGRDEITGVQVDSRRVEPGDLFVALGGGVDFLADALARGAAATLVPDDAVRGAGRARRAPSAPAASARVVGITGSAGKTSTKDILAALCAPTAQDRRRGGGFNNEIGLPLTLCRIEPDTEVGIIEMAMRGLGQIARPRRIARPDVGVITTSGPCTSSCVGTLENVARAKARAARGAAARRRRDRAGRSRARPFVRDGLDVVPLRASPTAGETAAPHVARADVELQLRRAPPGGERRRRARGARRARRRQARGPRRGRRSRAGARGVAAARRRPADQRRLEREPRLDARRARAPRRARRRAPHGRDPRRHGGARPRRARVPREIGERGARDGVDALVAVGELARGYLDGAVGVAVTRWYRGARSAARPRASSSSPATASSSRPRARSGSSSSPRRSRRCER